MNADMGLFIAVAGLASARALGDGRFQLKGHGPRPAAIDAPAPSTGELWAQAWPYGLAALLYPVFFQIGTVLLKYLDGNAAAGQFGVALAVMTAIYLFPSAVYQKFLLARLHRWATHDRATFARVYRLGKDGREAVEGL